MKKAVVTGKVVVIGGAAVRHQAAGFGIQANLEYSAVDGIIFMVPSQARRPGFLN